VEIQIKLSMAEALSGIGIRSANDVPRRDPSKFDVYYKNSFQWVKLLSVDT
jgi:hypothetical protein